MKQTDIKEIALMDIKRQHASTQRSMRQRRLR